MITFTMDGREVSSEQFADELKKEVTRAARGSIEERARAAVALLRCPQHGIAVQHLRVVYDGGDEGRIDATPCCEAMDPEISRAIRAAFEDE
jgi:hypothetical protein